MRSSASFTRTTESLLPLRVQCRFFGWLGDPADVHPMCARCARETGPMCTGRAPNMCPMCTRCAPDTGPMCTRYGPDVHRTSTRCARRHFACCDGGQGVRDQYTMTSLRVFQTGRSPRAVTRVAGCCTVAAVTRGNGSHPCGLVGECRAQWRSQRGRGRTEGRRSGVGGVG